MSLFNRVTDQETHTQMFSCGVYDIFKSLRTTAAEIRNCRSEASEIVIWNSHLEKSSEIGI